VHVKVLRQPRAGGHHCGGLTKTDVDANRRRRPLQKLVETTLQHSVDMRLR
jgi:hypothetical protein